MKIVPKKTLLIVLLVLLAAVGSFWWFRHGKTQGAVEGLRAGGKVMNLSIATPGFLQTDGKWADLKLGHGSDTLGSSGCTLCCLAMALQTKGIALTPSELNQQIESGGGFTDSGLIIWSSVKRVTGGKFDMVISNEPAHSMIDAELAGNNPVLAKVLYADRIPHWVLIIGKRGLDYLIKDPLGTGQEENMANYSKGVLAVRYLKSS